MREYQNPWPKIKKSSQSWRKHCRDRLVIEIGAGQGLHAIQYSQHYPKTCYIAIERTQIKYQKLLSRHQNHPDLHNLVTFNLDATRWISQNIFEREVDHYFILYPNPYPKKKQANKRWHHMPFMKYIYTTLKEKGKITLATNSEDYFQEAFSFFSYNKNVYTIDMAGTVANDQLGRSHFEKKYLSRKESCYELLVSKKICTSNKDEFEILHSNYTINRQHDRPE